MTINLISKNYGMSSQIAFKQQSAQSDKNSKHGGWGLNKAVPFTITGAGLGTLHAALYNKKSGKLSNLADMAKNSTLEDITQKIKDALNGKNESNVLSNDKKRTAKKALNILEGAVKKTAEKKQELINEAEKCLRGGTKPYKKAAFIGGLIGLATFGFHKYITEKHQ